ncbi:50S ribosomal protein L5 [Candidatus Gribaldobacteria bacterium]|nr:50S ribosomal protein L5 [Candidatus Gribaldobacteria bacterium]
MRLIEQYNKKIRPELMKELGLKNIMAVPRISKVSLNCGFGKEILTKNSGEKTNFQEHILGSLAQIAGQRPALRKAKKSIAGFKLREGSVVGALVTLRGRKMYNFLEKLIFVALPRKRDFRGIPLESITEQGNLTIGFKEYAPFPEIKIEREKAIFGFEVSITTTCKDKDQAVVLFKAMGFPLEKK